MGYYKVGLKSRCDDTTPAENTVLVDVYDDWRVDRISPKASALFYLKRLASGRYRNCGLYVIDGRGVRTDGTPEQALELAYLLKHDPGLAGDWVQDFVGRSWFIA